MIATDPAFGAAFGSGLALQAAVSGAAAMVTDGRWRDAGRLALLGLPVGSNGGDPTRPAGCPVVVSEREQVFGTTWERGDWFLRDRDGAVRLTRADARDAAEDLVAHPPPDLASLLADA
jgi:regulator of RNase E activity RraA